MTGDFEAYLGPDGDLAALLKLEDDAGIEKVVLMPLPEIRPDNLGVVASAKGSDRVIPCACVNPSFGREAVDELITVVRDHGMKGLKLMPPRHGYVISSQDCDPFMDAALMLSIPVTIHSGPSPAHPLEIAALCARHPNVPVIMDHMGHRYWSDQAIQAARQCESIHLGTTIAAFEPGLIARAVREVGAERVVFGSNAPSAFPDLAVESIKRAKLGDRAEELILGENLARIYRLK